MTQHLRWALVGASDIAATRVLPAIRAMGDTAVVVRSGDVAHGATWAGRHGVGEAVTDPRALLERDDVDAVYVSSVNARHREHVEAATAAGKHVLAEKPLALSLADAVAPRRVQRRPLAHQRPHPRHGRRARSRRLQLTIPGGQRDPLAQQRRRAGRGGSRDDLYEVTVRAFGAAARGEGEVLVSGEDGVRSLAFSLAVLDSLRTGTRTPSRAGRRPVGKSFGHPTVA